MKLYYFFILFLYFYCNSQNENCENISLVNLGDDFSTCEESIILDAGSNYDSYLWSTGETTQAIEVSEPGNYNVSVVNNNTVETLIYETDFEGVIGDEFSNNQTIFYNNSNILGNFGGSEEPIFTNIQGGLTGVTQNTTLSLNDLPSHYAIKISFDLYIIDSWDYLHVGG